MDDGYMGYGPMGMYGGDSSLGDNGFGMYGMHALGGTNRFMPSMGNMYSPDEQIFYSGTGQGAISSMQGWRDPTYALSDTSLVNMIQHREPLFRPLNRGQNMQDYNTSSTMEFETMISDLLIDQVGNIGSAAALGGAFLGGPLGWGVSAIGTGVSASIDKIREASEENYRNMVDVSGISNSFVSSSGKFGATDERNVELLRAIGADAADDLTLNRQENMDLFKESFSQGLMSGANDAQGAIETFKKLKKALLTVQDVTGSTDLKETLAEIAKMKQYGFSLDQSTAAIGALKVSADIAGVKKEDINDLHQSAMYMSGERSASAQNITREMADSLAEMKMMNSFGASSGRLSNTNSYVMAQQEVSKMAEKTLYDIGGVDINQKKIMATEVAKEQGTNAQAELDKMEAMTAKEAAIFKREFLATRGADVSSFFNQAMSDKGVANRIVAADSEMSGLTATNPIDLLIGEAINIIKKAGKSVNSNSVMSQIESMADLDQMSEAGYEVLTKKVGIASSPLATRKKKNLLENTHRLEKANKLESEIRRSEEANSLFGELVQAKDHTFDFFQNLAGKQKGIASVNRKATEKFGNLATGSTSLLTSEINIKERKEAEEYEIKVEKASRGSLDQFLNSDIFNEDRTLISASEKDKYVQTEEALEKARNTFRYSQYTTAEGEIEMKAGMRQGIKRLEEDDGDIINFIKELTLTSSTKKQYARAMLVKNDAATTVYAENNEAYESKSSLTKQQRMETNALANELISIRDGDESTLDVKTKQLKAKLEGKTDYAIRQLAKADTIGRLDEVGKSGDKYMQSDNWFATGGDVVNFNENLFASNDVAEIKKGLESVRKVAVDKAKSNAYEITDGGVYNDDVAAIMEASKSQEISRIAAVVKERGLTQKHLQSAFDRQGDKNSDEGLAILHTMKQMNMTVRKDIFKGRMSDDIDNNLSEFMSQDDATKTGLVDILNIAEKVKRKAGDKLKDVSVEEITKSLIEDGISGDYNKYLTDADTKVVNDKGKAVYNTIGGWNDIWELEDNIAGASMSMKLSDRELDEAKKEALSKATYEVFKKSGKTEEEAENFLAILEKSKTGTKEERATAKQHLRDEFGIISKVDKAYKENMQEKERKDAVEDKLNALSSEEQGEGVEKQQLKEAMTTNELLEQVVIALSE